MTASPSWQLILLTAVLSTVVVSFLFCLWEVMALAQALTRALPDFLAALREIARSVRSEEERREERVQHAMKRWPTSEGQWGQDAPRRTEGPSSWD
jgi:hypothetical protein